MLPRGNRADCNGDASRPDGRAIRQTRYKAFSRMCYNTVCADHATSLGNGAVLAYLLLLFTVVPLVEIALLFWLARTTSWTVAFAVALLTGFLGAALARRQGLGTWRRIQQELSQGRVPATSLLDGVMILMAGVMLITPGLLTDAIGLLLLVPPARAWIRHRLVNWLKRRTAIRFQMHGFGPARGPQDESIIDAEFTRKTDEPNPADEDRRIG